MLLIQMIFHERIKVPDFPRKKTLFPRIACSHRCKVWSMFGSEIYSKKGKGFRIPVKAVLI